MGAAEWSRQLQMFAQSILLGVGAGMLYDCLRPFRARFPAGSGVLDGLYSLAVGLGAFAFLLRCSDGELRGFLVAGGLGGAGCMPQHFPLCCVPCGISGPAS